MAHLLKELVVSIPDPRSARHVGYPLHEILFLSIVAVICGANGPSDIAVFGQNCLSWLRQYYAFNKGVPSHDTINRVLGLIGIKQFEQLFYVWVKETFNLTEALQVAIDGKKNSRSVKKAAQQLKKDEGGEFAELIINAYVPGLCLTLGQANEGESQSEVAGARKLIEMLDLQGVCISADAGFLGRELIDLIVDKQGDYLITLKAKSPKVYGEVTKAFEAQDAESSAPAPVVEETGHGRKNSRQCSVLSIDQIKDEKARQFYTNVKQIIRVVRHHQPANKKLKVSTHYYITSLEDDLPKLEQLIRNHWSVENHLHHTLDVQFQEDSLAAQVNNLSNNLSLIRKVALNLLTAHHGTVGTKKRRFTAALNESVRDTLIKPMMR